MRPWMVDADDIRLADDLDERYFHRTPWIDAFLDKGNSKFLVVATKGFGKTFLLKAQRVTLQRSCVCLPKNSLIDKPAGDKIFSQDGLALYAHSTHNWRKLWLISIIVAILKELGTTKDLVLSAPLRSLLENQELSSVIDHFVTVLDFSRSDLFKASDETEKRLIPRLRTANQPVAAFIDSVDEYFIKHTRTQRSSETGLTHPGIWYFSQMGLVEAAYQLRRINHHIRVFAAVRKEAFARFDEDTSMVMQYSGSAIDINYSPESLRSIFHANILQEKRCNILIPSKLKTCPISAFLGLSRVTHSYTKEHEPLFEYMYRHTMGRPRDFMALGQRLSAIPLSERTEATIKDAVNRVATQIAGEYLAEIALHIETLSQCIDSTHISIKETLALLPCKEMRAAQLAQVQQGRNDIGTVLCLLFRAGLLGVVEEDPVQGKRVQSFMMPGQCRLEEEGELPSSSHYLVHPCLTEIIRRQNPRYLLNNDRTQIIGNGRPWA